MRPKRHVTALGTKNGAVVVRNLVFGVEDSLVSTVGLLSGVAAGGVTKSSIVLTGIVLIFVEAFSMAVGSLLSEESAEEYLAHKEVPLTKALSGSIIMFVSYFLSGFVPLSPYLIFPSSEAFYYSNAASLVALFVLGVVSASFFKIPIFRHGVRMLVVGGLAVFVGVIVGNAMKTFL